MKKIVNYDTYLSPLSGRRQPSAIRALAPLVALPGMISLGGGMPNPTTFPFSKLTLEVVGASEPVELEGDVLRGALQYSATRGLPAFVAYLRKFQRRHHSPPLPDDELGVQVTTGSQDALTKAFEMLLTPDDTLLIEDPSYPGALAWLRPFGCKLAPIAVKDGDGINPVDIEALLESWPEGTKRPRVLYVIPNGQNPSGATLSLERKRMIYELACKYDFIVLEDDPYYFLALDGEPVKSFLSMDVEGRVLRFDSFSKILSAGLRVGFCTGAAPLISRLELHMQATELHVCGVSQVLLVKLLEKLGHDGFDRHVISVRKLYAERRDWALKAATEHLGGQAEFFSPSAGMFLWLKLKGIEDAKALINEHAVKAKVLMVPGSAFSPTGLPSPYVRASFSMASEENINEAFRRLAKLLRELE